jgi:hypothetical protein
VGEFAFGCVTGAIVGDCKAVEFAWGGNDEMDEACGDGWAELQPDGSIIGQICFHRGDEAKFHRASLEDFFNALLAVPALQRPHR